MDFDDKMKTTHISYIHETKWESWSRDAGTAFTFLFLWSVGYFAGISALEWVGVSLGCFVLFFRVLAQAKRSLDKRLTPTEARAWLDKHFPEATT